MEEKRYSAAQLAQNACVSVRTIRFYEKEKLLSPVEITETGRRIYNEDALRRLQKILTLKYVGYSLEEIRDLLKKDALLDFSTSLAEQKRMLLAKRKKLDKVIRVIEEVQNADEDSEAIEKVVDIMQALRANERLASSFNLHEKYSVNAYGWYPWLFDQLHLTEGMRILDIGCGVGLIWQRNMEKIPQGCSVTCLDKNADALETLRSGIEREHRTLQNGVEFRMVCGKAEDFCFEAQKYDCVIASYVLGFVKDQDALLEKVRSALKPGGRLFVAASGERKFHQLHELADEFFGKISPISRQEQVMMSSQELERLLDRHFGRRSMARYEDSLVIDSAEDICSYLFSASELAERLDFGRRQEFAAFVARRLEKIGPMKVDKDGRFYCCIL